MNLLSFFSCACHVANAREFDQSIEAADETIQAAVQELLDTHREVPAGVLVGNEGIDYGGGGMRQPNESQPVYVFPAMTPHAPHLAGHEHAAALASIGVRS